MNTKRVLFTIADSANLPYANMMIKSLRKFHSAEELTVVIVAGEELDKRLKDDPAFFYRATPIIASELFAKGFETVIKADADQLILGDLNHILDSTGYDVGTVLNFNRGDFNKYGPIQVAGIYNTEYYNCGFVVMKNPKFAESWKRLCFSNHFERYQYREQDLLNFMCFYGEWKVKCFDNFEEGYNAWHGLLSKNEGMRMKLVDNKIILPAGEEYPTKDVETKLYHWAGEGKAKMNYRICFPEKIQDFITKLIS